MTDREKLAAIRACGCFDSWIDSSPDQLLRFFDEVTVGPGERIAVEGAPCHQFILVADGRLETCSGGRVGALQAGDSFGWVAMESRGPNEATVVAPAGARLLVMSHAQFGAAGAPPPARRFPRWALPSSRRSLPRRPTPLGSVEAKNPGANPAC